MTFEDAILEIESVRYSVRVNIASDLKTFIRAVESEEAVRTLQEKLGETRFCLRLLRRLREIVLQLVDLRYENPWDSTVATYVWLLSSKEEELERMAAGLAMQARNCWWAEKIARNILTRSRFYNDPRVADSKLVGISERAIISEAGEGIFPYLYTDLVEPFQEGTEFAEIDRKSSGTKPTPVSVELGPEQSLFPTYIRWNNLKAA